MEKGLREAEQVYEGKIVHFLSDYMFHYNMVLHVSQERFGLEDRSISTWKHRVF